MGRYEPGGSNVIGVAVTDEWAAGWTVDTPYIHVWPREVFDNHEDAVRDFLVRGTANFMLADGNSGMVHEIGTNGDLDETGWPKFFDTASEYVANELRMWARDDGADYSEALAV
jgi:hypothetical protein